jgi:hypothetical protein
MKHRAEQFARVIYPFMFLIAFSLLFNLYNLLMGTGNPMILITNGASLSLILIMVFLKNIDRL